jgi:hypothetical protein
MRLRQVGGDFWRACCQMRMTFQPRRRSWRFTRRSRAMLSSRFLSQNFRLVLGRVQHLGQPCQKHPSTKTATFCLRNAKSGFPGKERCLLQPVVLLLRSNNSRASSVCLFPLLRMSDIILERCDLSHKFAFIIHADLEAAHQEEAQVKIRLCPPCCVARGLTSISLGF